MASGVRKTGLLLKEGGRFKSWKKRWFVLECGVLRYYKDKHDTKCLGEIELQFCGQIGQVDRNKKPCFQLQTPARTFHLICETAEERDEWIAAVTQVIHDLKPQAKQEATSKVGADDFIMMRLVGKGNFGRVMLVKMKTTGKVYAMKVLSKSQILEKGEIEHTMCECAILQKISHPFLVKLHYSFQTPENVRDWNLRELFHHLQNEKKFSEERVRFYAAEILLGLEHLHNSSIIYRDIKLENLLLGRDGHVVITDFGLSKQGLVGPESRTETFCGTPEYMAPEMLAPPAQGYGKEVDWWSYGSLLYEMLTGLPPFFCDDVQKMYQRILNEQLTFPSFVSPLAQDYLARLLAKNPSERLSDPNLMKRHKFFDGINWQDLYLKKIAAPFIPAVASEEDVSQVDPEFLNSPAIVDGAKVPETEQAKFAGFTYVKPE